MVPRLRPKSQRAEGGGLGSAAPEPSTSIVALKDDVTSDIKDAFVLLRRTLSEDAENARKELAQVRSVVTDAIATLNTSFQLLETQSRSQEEIVSGLVDAREGEDS